ncbi:MAG: ParB/RepB/Spo0J family partition protein [Geodermatophilaceae bacterium]|nr:ParB/RepB/Spo0J family partition protein [Geodermatophilaceae bacterium]
MTKRGGLGRGLAALIPTSAAPTESGEQSDPPLAESMPQAATTAPATAATPRPEVAANADPGTGSPVEPVPGLTLREIPLQEIEANPAQPRQVFDEDALAELSHSIRAFGLLQPIVVRRLDTGRYQLVMGERRLRAAALAGLETVAAIVRDTADDELLRDALLENIHRVQLNPLEEAAAYDQLLVEFGVTHEELATRLGRSRSQITNTIRLLRLPVPVQRRVAAGVLSAGHARALLGLEETSAQELLATRIVAEGLSVRATEELVATTAASTPGTARARRTGRITAPGAEDLAERLSDVYDTRVRVEIGRRKGRVVVEFGSIQDLERIVALMAPQTSQHRRGSAQDSPA